MFIIITIADTKMGTIGSVKTSLNCIEVLQSYDIKCFDFHFNSTGDLFHSPVLGENVDRISISGTTETVFNTSPKIILAIHVNMCDELMIEWDRYNISKESCRQVVILNSNFEFKTTYVAHIVTDLNNHIYIIDWLDHNHCGRILGWLIERQTKIWLRQ